MQINHAHNFVDITGQKFNRLTAIRCVGKDKHNYALWEFKCDCGKTIVARGKYVRNGNTKSCGCYNIDSIKARNKIIHRKHGETHTKLFHIWTGMLTRCNNKNAINFHDYGAKGVSVCEEWAKDFIKFRDWALENGYSPELTIDRRDFNGNYEPDNCRWITMKEQQRNRSSNKLITYKGETHCMVEWAEIVGIKYDILQKRLNNPNYSVERALTEPPRPRKKSC